MAVVLVVSIWGCATTRPPPRPSQSAQTTSGETEVIGGSLWYVRVLTRLPLCQAACRVRAWLGSSNARVTLISRRRTSNHTRYTASAANVQIGDPRQQVRMTFLGRARRGRVAGGCQIQSALRLAATGRLLPQAAPETGHPGERPLSRSATGSCRPLPNSGVSAIRTLESRKPDSRSFEPHICAIYPERSAGLSTGSLAEL